MVGKSIGCVDRTYSCIHCGECGRKFTRNGIDDSEVVPRKIDVDKRFLTDEWKDILIEINMNV